MTTKTQKSTTKRQKMTEVRGQVPTRRGEAAVHVGSVPGLHGAVDRRQSSERSLARRRRNHDDRLILPILVFMTKPRPRPQTWTNHTGLRT